MRRKSGQRPKRNPDAIPRLKWRKVVNPYAPLEILSEDQIEAIHVASLEVLRDSGIKFLSAKARKILQSAGAEVDNSSNMVRFDPALVEELIGSVPPSFTLTARNQERSLEVGGRNINFSTVGGPSFVSDFDRGRRSGTLADLEDFFKIVHELEIFHLAGVEFI